MAQIVESDLRHFRVRQDLMEVMENIGSIERRSSARGEDKTALAPFIVGQGLRFFLALPLLAEGSHRHRRDLDCAAARGSLGWLQRIGFLGLAL